MASDQISLPWTRGYDFGVGADLITGSPKARVVEGERSGVEGAQGATVDLTLQRVHSTRELEQTLGIDVEASYGSAAFGAGMSARFNYARRAKVQSSSLFMALFVRIELEFLSIDEPALSDVAGRLMDKPDVFASRYGDMFVRGVGRGGLFVGTLRIDTSSSEESEEISAALKGSYGLFSAEAKTKFEEVQKQHRSEVFIDMHHEGGPVDLKITDPTDPLQLLDNANRFLDSFQKTPETVAVPYHVTLAPIAIANGPLPPNAADIQKAQDVLIFCANRRSVLIDQQNLLQFIVDNPSRFDYSNGADKNEIATAATNTQNDLDLIAACASAAMNSPAEAERPAGYAADHGETYPSASMPSLLPLMNAQLPPAATGPSVVVPGDLVGYSYFAIFHPRAPDSTSEPLDEALIQRFEMYLTQFNFEPVEDPDHAPLDHGGPYDVFKVEPAPGSSVPTGSTVRLYVQAL